MLLRAARQVVEEEGFDDMLDQTRDRVDEIEGRCILQPLIACALLISL